SVFDFGKRSGQVSRRACRPPTVGPQNTPGWVIFRLRESASYALPVCDGRNCVLRTNRVIAITERERPSCSVAVSSQCRQAAVCPDTDSAFVRAWGGAK